MKKTLKSILSGAMILSMLGGYAVPVSAETDSTGEFYYKSVPCRNENIDMDSKEFHDFLQNAEIYNSGFQHSAEDKFYTIQYNIIGNDKNGNPIITDKYSCALKGFDENDVPIIMYEQLAIPDLAMLCGFDSEFGPIYCGYNEFLVRENENGERKLVNMEWIKTNNKFYISRTVDLHTGKNIIVKQKNNTYDYVVIEQGDVNLDENVNIIDVAKYAQHIIKISEIPEYADIAADMNGDAQLT